MAELNVLYLLIVASEAAFWIVLLASLAARYLQHRAVMGHWLLLCAALDRHAGAAATPAHAQAAVYAGFTIMFGSVVVRWADARFAHRFASGAAPPGRRSGGRPCASSSNCDCTRSPPGRSRLP